MRKLLNAAFLQLLMTHGLDASTDSWDPRLMMSIAAAEALLGRDASCKNYLRAYRGGKLDLVTTTASSGARKAVSGVMRNREF